MSDIAQRIAEDITNTVSDISSAGIEDEVLEHELTVGFQNVLSTLNQNFETQKDKEKALLSEAKNLTDNVLFGFETTIKQLKQSHIKHLNTLLELEKNSELTKDQQDAKLTSISTLNGINQLETNNNLFEYISSITEVDKDSFKNIFILKKKIEKLKHVARRVKIKASLLDTIYEDLTAVQSNEYKLKMTVYLNLFLDSVLSNKTVYPLRHYILFQIGLIRMSVKSTTTFLNMEKVYSTFFGISMGTDLRLKTYENLKSIEVSEEDKVTSTEK